MDDIISLYREEMKKSGIGLSIIPTSDYHMSEYITDYFKVREYLSGFTGSNGTLLISADLDEEKTTIKDSNLAIDHISILDEALLWTDGRYFLQAEEELKDTEIVLMKMGEKNTSTLVQYICKKFNKNRSIGLNKRLFSIDFINNLENALIKEGFDKKDIKILDFDPVDKLWPNRPNLPKEMIYVLEDYFSGESFKDKKKKVMDKVKERGADALLLSSLEDQAWLYNLRGNDIKYTPVFLAYTLMTDEKTILYVDKAKFGYGVEEYLRSNEIIVRDYEQIFKDILGLKKHKIFIDSSKLNYDLFTKIPSTKNEIIYGTNPTLLLKAIKNPKEIENTKKAHLKDAIAVTKFIYQIKNKVKDKESICTEYQASQMILELRKNQPGFIEPSFETICGYNAHAAMMHYAPTATDSSTLEPSGILLIDSGGHYLEGSTDITRTIALGPVDNKIKEHFTYVLKSVIGLSKAIFLNGTTGFNLDILARGPIWNHLLNYRCGTGHGVGHILGVHEGPNNFRYNTNGVNINENIIVPGMITTNEPGIYIDGEYGIRTENEMLCVKKGESEYGEFYGFETITYVPIDLDLIDESLLTKEEKDYINKYHQEVRNRLQGHLDDNEQSWLQFATKVI